MTEDSQQSDPETSPNDSGRGRSRRRFLEHSALVGGGALALTLDDLGVDAGSMSAVHDEASVRFTNQQTAGDRVVVDAVSVSLGGFVVIHDARLFQGDVVESVIGVSDVLEPGDHDDVPVPLYRDVPGAEFEESTLSETQLLVAMAHFDANENGEYDFVTSGGTDDGPYLESEQPVVDVGFAVLEAGVHFRNQQSDGSSVTVDQATLPEGGFVTMHDGTLLEGQVTESVVGVSAYLGPGRHEGVDVGLYTGVPGAEFDQDGLEDDQPLIAMPHLDTDGNEEYGFVDTGGEEDGPYIDDGQPIVDVGFVTVGGGGDG